MDEKLELVAEMLELAKQITAELECAETAETVRDIDHAINEACKLARQLLAMKDNES